MTCLMVPCSGWGHLSSALHDVLCSVHQNLQPDAAPWQLWPVLVQNCHHSCCLSRYWCSPTFEILSSSLPSTDRQQQWQANWQGIENLGGRATGAALSFKLKT